jgi:hypothetical protein
MDADEMSQSSALPQPSQKTAAWRLKRLQLLQ